MRETLRRALRTFFQAALGYACANLAASAAGMAKDGDVLVAFIASALAAGLAAVMNLPKSGGGEDRNETEDKNG